MFALNYDLRLIRENYGIRYFICSLQLSSLLENILITTVEMIRSCMNYPNPIRIQQTPEILR